MKNRKKVSTHQTQSKLTVTATIDEMMFLEELVKHLADGRRDTGYSQQEVQPTWKAIDTSSIEAYVSGNMMFSDTDDSLNMPYITGFIFTCIKEDKGEYSLEGSFSLS